MSNRVLREYMDWWTGTYIHVYMHKSIYVQTLMNSDHIDRFVSQWKERYNLGKPITEREDEEVDDIDLFNLSGLSVLIMTKGIVAAWRVLKTLDGLEEDYKESISDTLKKLSRDKLIQTLDKTTSQTYNKVDMIDFVSVAKEALHSQGIVSYDEIDYRVYFEERK